MASMSKKVLEFLGMFPWSVVLRHFGEFSIVFVGIYLAFLLTYYQEELRERQVRVKYYENLIREFDSLAQHLVLEQQKLLNHLAIVEENEQGKGVIIRVSNLNFCVSGRVFEDRRIEL